MWQEHGTLSMIIQKQIMKKKMKLIIRSFKIYLCDYNNAYILVRGDVTVTASLQIEVVFKNCAPCTKCITKIDGTTIYDAENLYLVMPIYNLIEYSSNYSKKTVSLWFYSNNFNINFANTNNFKYFKHKAKLLENTVAHTAANAANGMLRNATIAVTLKYLSNFWRSREMPLINYKVELKLKWTKYWVLSVFGTESVINNNNDANNIITSKDEKIMGSCCNFISKKQSKAIKTSEKRIWKISLLERI